MRAGAQIDSMRARDLQHSRLRNNRVDLMKEILSMAIAAALAVSLSACGRDDRQEKAGATATDTRKGAPSAPVTGADAAAGATKGPLQTGEQPPTGAQVPSGTTTGARTTPDPK